MKGNPNDYVQAVHRAAAEAVGAIQKVSEESIRSMRVVEEATRTLPERSSDILESATLAFVNEVQVDNDTIIQNVSMNSFSSNIQIFCSYGNAPEKKLLKGKYRLMVFAVPIK